MNARNGKIARLPRFVRDELNERLECSEESPQLLDWLNALPEVQKVVTDAFGGVPISKQNLSQWRLGGFQEWLARRDLLENARDLTQLAEEMNHECEQSVLADDVAQVLTARFGSLIANWDGEVDEKFEAKSRVLNRLCRSVVQLQRAMHCSRREMLEIEDKLEEKEKAEQEAHRKQLQARIWASLQEPKLTELLGGGKAAAGLAKIMLELQHDLPPLETGASADDEKVKKPVKPVKPANAKKVRTRKVDKPLKNKTMNEKKQVETAPGQSESVTVGQSDMATSNETGLRL